ncbi:MAG: RluA family pseudouridine synthase [Ruminococcus sp.]|nr:RluA family pseudouridine synthase [Ruminococcus sp.]MCM1382819.1 RluA family pseudouridine synthase [Muribaculaceae bacterium]MCM1479796.1 RluA family pseudouridine synthase [Muribaculaceae bacterium]
MKRIANTKKSQKSAVTSFTVETPAPLLEFLINSQPAKPRGKVKSEMEHGLATVDGKPVTKYNYPLKAGQTVTVGTYTPKFEKAAPKGLDIIFEDDELLAVNKPAGMLAIANEKERDMTAYHLAMEYVRSRNSHNRVFVVHRLDRDTSGVLIFAKNEAIKHALQDSWETAAKLRAYTAVTEGTPNPPEGRIENYLRETETHLVYPAKMGDGKRAVTNYTVRKSGETYALVDVNIETGRKNQIRVHMSGMGCPVAGDKKYGAATNPVHRLCLHANRLVIVHPHTEEEMVFDAPVPKKILQLVK